MTDRTIKITVTRREPGSSGEPRRQIFEAPFVEGQSVMDALDAIYQDQDGTLAYYDHAGCSLGICGRCTARIDGRPGLLCQTPLTGDVTVEPLAADKVLRDLVVQRTQSAKEAAPEKGSFLAEDVGQVGLLVRREIEALVAVPLIKGYIAVLGREKALETAREVIRSLALDSGRMLAAFSGGNGMEQLQRALPMFGQGGALEFEIVETDARRAGIDVTRCRYAEMYKEHGLEDFGFLLSCGRDYALMEGFNPKIRFTRTQTIMEGAERCDFRFEAME